jgi:Fur family ferric uptake transcriptional regulator
VVIGRRLLPFLPWMNSPNVSLRTSPQETSEIPDSQASDSLGSVPVSMSPIERFEEYLQSRGQRNTEQRRFLIERVFSHHEHFDADQLMDQLPRKGSPNYVSRPTVYRTLKEFVDAGLLRSFELNGRSVYEHDYGYPQHDHFYCTKCHKLLEFRSEAITQLLEEIAKNHKFRARGHRLTVNGICDECSKQRSRVRRSQDRV